MGAGIFWDKKISKEDVREILKDEDNPRFLEFASLTLSRQGKPREVFKDYLDKLIFIRNWRRIKRWMRKDKWDDNRILFWDEVYNVLSQGIDKAQLKRKEKREPVTPEIMRIGEEIKRSRKRNSWSQKELAEKAGVSQQLISFTENGYNNISLETLEKILSALKLKISITG